MSRTLTHGYNAEISRTSRQREKWYLNIEVSDSETITVDACGESGAARPWLFAVTEPSNAFDSSSDITLYFTDDILALWNQGKLLNRIAYLYRYRGLTINNDLVLSGRLWGPPAYDASNKLFRLRLIGFGATEITGELPANRFNLSNYPGCPEENLQRGIPIVIGDVYGSTPVLCDVGGWGELSADIAALPTDGFTGTIPLIDGRGSAFAQCISWIQGLTQDCNAYQDYIRISETMYFAALTDDGAGWLLIDDEIMRGIRKYKSGAYYFVEVVRGGLFTTAASHTTASPAIREVGAVSIGSEVAVYKNSYSDALGNVKTGFSGTASPHSAGETVRQYLPTYRWKVADHKVRTLDIDKIYFLNTETNKLTKNPFTDYTAIDKTDAEIKIINTMETIQVALDSYVFSGTESYEVIPLNTVTTSGDTSNCFSNINNVIDETGLDPVTGNTPSTYSGYSVNAVPVSFYPSQHQIFQSQYVSNPANAHDENTNTYATIDLPPEYQSSNKVGIKLKFTPDQFSALSDDYIVINGYLQIYSHGGYADYIPAFKNKYYILEQLATWHHTQSENQGDYESIQFYVYPTPYSPDFYRTDGFWQNLDIYGPEIELDVVCDDWDGSASVSDVLYREARIVVDLLSRGHIRCKNTSSPSHIVDTVRTCIAVYASDNNWELQYDDEWSGSADTWGRVGHSEWYLKPIEGSEDWDSAADWQKYINIRPASPEFTGKLYSVMLVNYYSTNGTWTDVPAIFDGDDNSYAVYTASGEEVALEIKTTSTPDEDGDINAVRLKVKATHNLGTTCQIGLGTPGNSASVASWYTIPRSGTTVIDVTGSENGPGAGSWNWNYLNATDASGLSIFVKTNGSAGQELKLYSVSWDVISAAEINPETAPLVISEMTGISDVLSGPYGSTVIRNPAWAEKYLLREHVGINSGRIDNDAYSDLATIVNDIKLSAVISDVEPAETVIQRIRNMADYRAISSNGIIKAQAFPVWNDTAAGILDNTNTFQDALQVAWGAMENLCNYPIAEYKRRYYDDATGRAILPRLTESDNRRRVDKILLNNTQIMDKRSRNRLREEAVNLAEDYAAEWAIAQSSYNEYGGWFKRVFQLDYIADVDSVRAVLARLVRRYAFLPPIITVSVSPRIADQMAVYDVTWLVRPDVPKLSNYAVPGSRLDSEYAGQWAVKCAILEIAPDGEERILRLEAIRNVTTITTIGGDSENIGGSVPTLSAPAKWSEKGGDEYAGWDAGVWQ